jgi:hypothetical protein
MSDIPARAPRPAPDLPLLASLYVLEAAAWLAVIASYKTPVRSLLTFPPRASGVVFLVAGLTLLSAAAVLVRRYRAGGRRRFGFTVALNLVPVLLLVAAGEMTVRLMSSTTPRGLMIGNTVLLPHRWRDVAERNEAILGRLRSQGSHLAPDSLVGWVLGPDRRSADGRYSSSVEGIRSPGKGDALAARRSRHRVALVGDSFTFGLDVAYEDSWGDRLERALGRDVQVLNFGVEAYGVDQAYLRYLRDVRPWRPDVVILGLIDHDLYRSMAVYFFVSFPGWDYPFAKPRFVSRGGELALLNAPLPAPEAVAAARSIGELPFVEHDPDYRAEAWRWHPLDRSYLHRLLVSTYAKLTLDTRPFPQEMLALNRDIVRAFVREARAQGAAPIVVYFPSDRNFRALARDRRWRSLAQTMLEDGDIAYIDTTACLTPLPPADRFPADGRNHLAPRANAAVAACLRDGVRESLARTSPR